MNKTILLIRHAESTANAGLASASPELIPLTEKGKRQARQLAVFLTTMPDLIAVSPFLRARQTAAPLIERFSNADVEDWTVQEFTYLSRTRGGHSTVAMRKPLVDEFWRRSEPDYCDGKDAESFRNFILRVREILQKLENLPHRSIAVVTHGQFIRAALWLILTGRNEIDSPAMKNFFAFLQAIPFPNAAYVKISFAGHESYVSNILTDHLESSLISF